MTVPGSKGNSERQPREEKSGMNEELVALQEDTVGGEPRGRR